MQTFRTDLGVGTLNAVVGGLAIPPTQMPDDCGGLHIIHVLEDKLCVWKPSRITREKLTHCGARLTLVLAQGYYPKVSLGNSLHGYSSFILNHLSLPIVPAAEYLPLQRILCRIPSSPCADSGFYVFAYLGWAIAEGVVRGGFGQLTKRIQRSLRNSDSLTAMQIFEKELIDTLASTSAHGGLDFDRAGLRCSLRALLRDVLPEHGLFC